MSEVASLELCKELYELSGWGNNPEQGDSSDMVWHSAFNKEEPGVDNWVCWGRTHFLDGNIPAYDLGYLLRKLPKEIQEHYFVLEICIAHGDPQWAADYLKGLSRYLLSSNDPDITHAESPEDAAAKLCCELFKQGILK